MTIVWILTGINVVVCILSTINALKVQEVWHTGEPTKDGWYLVVVEDYLKVRGEDCRYQTDYFNKYSRWRLFEEDRVIAWRKIKPHKRIASKA